jgi:hypothetical protein
MRRNLLWVRVSVMCLLLTGCRLDAQQGSGGAPAISGSGKTDFIPIWINSTTLSSSTLFEKAGKVGFGTQTPGATLEVNGTAKFDQAVTFASSQTFPGTASLGANTFTGTQTISSGDLSITNGNLDLAQTTGSGIGVVNLGGSAFIHACCPSSTQNTFVGTNAGNFAASNSQDGVGDNTAAGYQALEALTSGFWNTAVGGLALRANTGGLANTATGFQALQLNTAGIYNTAGGSGALANNVTGNYNTAMGGGALELTDSGGISNFGEYDTGIGYIAGQQNATGAFNTFLGAAANPSSNNLFGATAIGACATVSASYALVLGAPVGGGGPLCSGGTPLNTMVGIDVGNPSNILTVLQGGGHAISDGWDVYSSRRWKSGIRPLQGALGKVERLRGVEYTYTANGKHDIGMIAEDVGKVVPEVVSYEANGKEARGIDYARLTALLVEAIKEQQSEIMRLKSEVQALQEKK